MVSTAESADLSRYVVSASIPAHLVKSPALLEGHFGEAVYRAYEQERDSTYQGSPYLRLRSEEGIIVGSNLFDAVLVNQLLRHGNVKGNPRTPLLVDLSDPRVLGLIKGRYYADSQASVLRSTRDPSYSRNEPLARLLAEQKGVDLSRLEREPAMLSGFDLEPWPEDRKGYGLKLVPNAEFRVHHDERFLGRFSGYWFTRVDKLGIPADLNETRQSEDARQWLTRKDGLSGLYLYEGLVLVSDGKDLVGSGDDGRVVVLSGEATVPEKSE